MRVDIYASPNLLVQYSKEIEHVLRDAVLDALRRHKHAGKTIAAWKDGKIELIKAEDIRVESTVSIALTNKSYPVYLLYEPNRFTKNR